MSNIQFFDVINKNDSITVRGLLINDIKTIFISNKDIKSSSCSIGVNTGYCDETIDGTAHFIEHLLFLGSKKYPDHNEFMDYAHSHSGVFNAFTSDFHTNYYISIDHSYLKDAIDILINFFNEPIFNEKFIKSEMKNVHSEHLKNINNHYFIDFDNLNKFIVNNRFNKFGTGDKETLKNITRNDLLSFYNKFYKNNNIAICIVDNLDINDMIDEYSPIIQQINNGNTTYKEPTEKLKLIDNNLLIYKLKYNVKSTNIICFFNIDKYNQIHYQLIKLINFIIGNEYLYSLSYYLFENNYCEQLQCNVERFFDVDVCLSIEIMNDNNLTKDIICIVTQYFTYLKSLTFDDFEYIYNIYSNILDVNLYFDEKSSLDLSLMIVNNLLTTKNLQLSLIKDFNIENCTKDIYNEYLKIINSVDIKIITNNNFIKTDNFTKSEKYNSHYNISNFDFNLCDKKYNFNYDVRGFKNLKFNKNITVNKNIERNDKTFVIKYRKNDISYLSIIRKNNMLLNNKIRLLFILYIAIVNKLLNYYIDNYMSYKTYFDIYSNGEYYILDFVGLNNLLPEFTQYVLDNIKLDNVIKHHDFQKYFDICVNNLIKYYENVKFETPHDVCNYYFDILVMDLLTPDENIELLKSFNTDDIIKNYKNIFLCENEYLIMTEDLQFKSNSICKSIELNNNINVKKNINYVLKDTEINTDEKNNCLLLYYNVENFINVSDINIIKKNIILYKIISIMIHQPLYNELRTINKLGYIVECNFETYSVNGEYILFVYYSVQSKYNINILEENIVNFNNNYKQSLINEPIKFEKKFNEIKKSKLTSYKKKPISVYEDINFYKNNIILYDTLQFDYNDRYNLLKDITFEELKNKLLEMLNSNYYKIIYNVNYS